MNKKTFSIRIFAIGLTTIVAGVLVFDGIKKTSSSALAARLTATRGASGPNIVLNSSNVPTGLTSSYQNLFNGSVKTAYGNDVNLSFVNAKSLDGGFAQLANHGKIVNFNSGNNQVSAISGISFSGSGSLLFKPAFASGILMDVEPVTVTAGASKVSVPICDYFELEAGDSGASITSLELSFDCDPSRSDLRSLDGTYTGIGSDSSTYKLVVSNGSASIQSLDKPSNISLSGTVAMVDKDTAKCTFLYSTYNVYYVMDFDGHHFSFVSKSDDIGGMIAGQIATVSFDRVYNVEDFESYSASGQGYTSSTAKYQTTGLRSSIYADYYTGSSSGEIGGSGWPIMTSTDNTNYNSQKGHNSSKVGIFKFSNGTGMRYISMNELYGVKSVIGKGSTLSFWVRGAYTNTNFNTNHASNTPMKFYAYYGSPLTPSNQTTVRETFEFTVEAGETWQHFEMPLTSGRTYYGFGFFAQQSSGSTQYVPIDDIQIYTASPYAEYIPPVAVTGVSVSPTNLELITGSNSQLTANVAPSNATNKNVSWSSNKTSVATVDSEGNVHAVSAGSATITATTVDGGYTASCAVTVSDPLTYYPEGTFSGTAIVDGNSWKITIALGNQSNGLVAIRLANNDAGATGITYDTSNNTFTITTTGSYSIGSYKLTFGNITGTYDYANDRLTGITCNGTIKSYVDNNGSITATHPTTSSTSYFNDCDGTTEQLQSTFKRRYNTGSWQVDNINADRITSNTTEFVSGSGSVKRRGYTGGGVALNFNSDWSPAKTLGSVQFWVYNPHSSDITLRMWVYKATSFGSNGEIGSVTAKTGQWTYVAMGFGSYAGAIYNFQIADFNNTGAYLSFDNIYFF